MTFVSAPVPSGCRLPSASCSLNDTVPSGPRSFPCASTDSCGDTAATVAVKVTSCPYVDGFGAEMSEVVVCRDVTPTVTVAVTELSLSALLMPKPSLHGPSFA